MDIPIKNLNAKRHDDLWGAESMKMRVMGIIKEKESKKPLSGLLVCAYDKDVFGNDELGSAVTASDGKFIIEYNSEDFQELLDENPDIYLEIFSSEEAKSNKQTKSNPLFSTKESLRPNASSSEKFYIEIPKERLI